MAIKYKYQCTSGLITSAKPFTLKPKEDESIHITSIRCSAPSFTGRNMLKVSIDRNIVGQHLVNAYDGQGSFLHNGTPSGSRGGYYLDQGLSGYKLDYIVANGETIKFETSQYTLAIEIEYDIYDRDDLTNTMEGGSRSPTYYYTCAYSANAYMETTAGKYRTELKPDSSTPPEFLEPIYGNIGLSDHVECLGIGAVPFAKIDTNPSVDIRSSKLIITKNREVLGNKDGDGVALIATYNTPGNTSYESMINDFPLFPAYPNKTDVFDELQYIKSGDKIKFEMEYDIAVAQATNIYKQIYVFWKITRG